MRGAIAEYPAHLFTYVGVLWRTRYSTIVDWLLKLQLLLDHIFSGFIAVFNNMRTLKFKPQLTVYVFRCRQSSKRTSRETKAHFSRVKRSRLSVVIGRFRSILFVSGFQGSLAVAIIMIDGSEKPFELQSSHVIENCNNQCEVRKDETFTVCAELLLIFVGKNN